MRSSLKKKQVQQDKMIDQAQQIQEVPEQKIIGAIKKDKLVRKCNNDITQSYILLKKLGEGSFGQVFLVIHKQLKVKRALKIIKKSEKPHSNAADQLEILKKLDHPNILKIFEYFQSEQKWYIITQYFEGIQLFQEIIKNDRLSQEITARIVLEILKALSYIHNNKIAHRDIKAQNILIALKENQYIVKVIDWGLGAFTFGNHLNRKCGTPQYCAPEVLKGNYSIECDMWSLGVLVHIMLSGLMPFKGKNMNQTIKQVKYKQIEFTNPIWSEISMSGKLFVAGLLQRNPDNRLKAKDCLNHKWIMEYSYGRKKSETNQVNLSCTLKRIKDFSTETRFQVVVINYILNFIQTPKQLQRLKKQFQILDLNGDGEISFQELLIAYRKLYGPEADLIVEQIFASIDLDSSGKITFSQFVTVATELTQNFTNEKLKEAFQLFDTDNDGLIDQKQISELIQYQQSSRASRDLDDVVSEIDLNNDGKIDLSQFIVHINKAVERVRTKTGSSFGCESTNKNGSKQKKNEKNTNQSNNYKCQTDPTAKEPQSQILDSTFELNSVE